jgi:hypothetical protein
MVTAPYHKVKIGEHELRQPVGYPIGSHRGFRTTKTPK